MTLLILGLLWLASPPARAHAELRGSEPGAGSRVDSPPDEITMSFTEPPAGGAAVTVVDGCGTAVAGTAQARNDSLIVPLSGGRPGRWRVRYQVVSAVDGHSTGGSFGFVVRGERACDAAGDPSPEDGTTAEPPPIADEGDGDGGFPVVPVAIGAGVLVGAALVVRVLAAR